MTPDNETTGEASKTPLTDSIVKPYVGKTGNDHNIWKEADELLDHARSLETQLTAAQAVMEQLAGALERMHAAWIGGGVPHSDDKETYLRNLHALAAYKALTQKENEL